VVSPTPPSVVGWAAMRGRSASRQAQRLVLSRRAIAVIGAMVFSFVTISSGVAWPALSTEGQVSRAKPAFYTWQAPNAPPLDANKEIALTFDDGPGPYTPQVLAVLEQYHVPATFFEIGEMVADYPQYSREVVTAGYPVEDHTWSHPNLTDIPAPQVEYQIDKTQEEIRSVTGVTPECLRPPYDAWDAGVLDQIGKDGLTAMSYSVDSRDWTLPGVQAIVANVVNAAFPGAVVDLHDGGGPRYETVEALPQVIDGLRARGYSFMAICGDYKPASTESPVPHPLVLSARAVPSSLGSAGGTVKVVGAVADAKSCQLDLVSRQSFPVVYSHDSTTGCRSGAYTAYVVIGANPSPIQRIIAFDLMARHQPFSSSGRFYILLGPSPSPDSHI
jgi:peptidoglycan-N-acetylglucosamine deacetylase